MWNSIEFTYWQPSQNDFGTASGAYIAVALVVNSSALIETKTGPAIQYVKACSGVISRAIGCGKLSNFFLNFSFSLSFQIEIRESLVHDYSARNVCCCTKQLL